MESIRIMEGERIEIGNESTCISAEDAKTIETLAGNRVRIEGGKIDFGPYCGVIQTREIAIEILPKIDPQKKMPPGLFAQLIFRNREENLSKSGEDTFFLGRQNIHLLDIFIENFCSFIENALSKMSIYRYEKKADNLCLVRGKIEFEKDLQFNLFDRSRIFCRFDERTFDNVFNRILKFLLYKLLTNTFSMRTKSRVTSLLHHFEGVTDQHYHSGDFKRLNFDRTNEHWKEVYQEAEWLFSQFYPDVRTLPKKPDKTSDDLILLYNMERIFENVLGRRIREAYLINKDRGFRVELQKRKKHLASNKRFGLQPDITISKGEQVVAILDAKWKLLDPHADRAGVSRLDAFQMNTYADIYRCKNLALVYPAPEGCPQEEIAKFEFDTCENPTLHVITVDIADLAYGTGVPKGVGNLLDCIN